MHAVAYCRYSTDNQTENSIMYQISAAQDYCDKHSMDLVDVYSDEARSGTNTNREGLHKLIADCDTEKFSAVVIYDQSRLSRNIVDWFTLRETLHNKHKRLCSCCETLSEDILDSSSFMSEGVHAIFNEVHVLETRKKTIAGVTAKARRAEFCGGLPPLGYNIVDGQYRINEAEAPAIRTMFDMYADGYSYREIMNKIDSMGIRSKRGRKIGINSIYYLLINDRYTGVYTWNRYQYKQMRKRIPRKDNPNIVRVENAVPPLVSKDTYERVVKRLQENKRGTNKAKRDYLLSGMISCGYCGGSYTAFASKNRRTGEETIYYMCANKHRLHNCHAKNVRADEIESAVYYIVRDRILNEHLIERTADAIIAVRDQQPDKSVEIKKEIAQRQQAVNNLMKAIERGLNTEAAFPRIDELQLEIKTLQARLFACRPAGTIDRDKLIQRLTDDAKRIDGDFKQRRAVIKEYVSKIVITDESIEIQCIGDYCDNTGGVTQIRTGDEGFADPCLTTWL